MNFIDSYVEFRRGEAWLLSLHIAPYANAGYAPQAPDRARKLLLHAREIAKMAGLAAQKGLTVVPVRVYLKHGRIRLDIALGAAKKSQDQAREPQRGLKSGSARELA